MSDSLKIGVLGLTHDHVWGNLDELKETVGARLVAVADPHLPLLQDAKQKHGCATYESYQELVQSQQLDAVWLFSDNATNVELVEQAASQGLHAMVEKPMANNLAGAERMMAAARSHNVRLMINWPFAWWPQLQHAIALAKAGDLGRIWQVKYRAAHAGPHEMGCSEYFCNWLFDAQRNGAGALIDYCCYGALLARVLLGVPENVTGVCGRLTKSEISVEDNAILLMSYDGALAISEGSWSQVDNLSSYVTMIRGTEATLMVEPRTSGRLIRADAKNPDGIEIEVPSLPAHRRSASSHFIHCIQTGEDFYDFCDQQICRDAQEILEAGLRSATKGVQVSTPIVSG